MSQRSLRYESFADMIAPIGSEKWAERVREKLHRAIDREVSGAIEFSLEQAHFVESTGWCVLRDADGKEFISWESFCLAKRPHGLGCNRETFDRLRSAYERTAADRMKAAPIAKPVGAPEGNKNSPTGRKGKQVIKADNISIDSGPSEKPSREGYGTRAEYLAARIKRDAPEVAARVEAGEFKSIRAAAIEAGIVKVPTPEQKAEKAIAKLPAERRASVIAPALDEAAVICWLQFASVDACARIAAAAMARSKRGK